MSKKQKFIIFTGPSGVGKASIEKHLFRDADLNLAFSVSATTRKPREGEIDGSSYIFIEHDDFDKKIANDEFVEWNEHFGNKYGTLTSEIDRIFELGKTPFLEVEVMGATQILNKYSEDDILSIFIMPPTVEDLEKRIVARGSETPDQVQVRVKRAELEMGYADRFKHVVVNDDITNAVSQVKQILMENL